MQVRKHNFPRPLQQRQKMATRVECPSRRVEKRERSLHIYLLYRKGAFNPFHARIKNDFPGVRLFEFQRVANYMKIYHIVKEGENLKSSPFLLEAINTEGRELAEELVFLLSGTMTHSTSCQIL